MSKRITYLILCILISQLCNAQIADGSVAPNITGVDIAGNKFDIYEILASGKGVVLEISTTWCSPCWTMHKTHFLDLINETYGPNGTDELVVLFLKGDDQTDLADLEGTGDFTVGDWTYCTKVPILDNMASTGNDYQISFWGTYFVINPKDKTTKSFSSSNSSELKPHLVEIGIIDLPQMDASMGFLCDEGPQYICSKANKFVPQLELYNLGASPLTTLSFDIFIDDVFHSSQNWAGNISSFKSEKLNLDPIVVSGPSDITVIINQDADGNLTSNKKQFNVQLSTASSQSEVTVRINTDNLGVETYWHIEDDMGNIVASGGNPWVGITNIGIGFGADYPETPAGTYENNQMYTEKVILESPRCYNFVITDYYGGGIRDDLGGYIVSDHLGNVLFSGAEFDDIVVHPFLNAAVLSESDSPTELNIKLYSNLAYDQLNIAMDITQADISIFDLQGKKMHQSEWNQEPIEISNFSTGIYILRVSSGDQNWTRRFVKN